MNNELEAIWKAAALPESELIFRVLWRDSGKLRQKYEAAVLRTDI
jgi:hypothetical protein